MKIKAIMIIIKLCLIAIPVALGIWLVNLNIVPTGHIGFEYNFKNKSAFISQPGPTERLDDREKDIDRGWIYQRMLIDPVYFTVNMPRSFNTAKVTLEYQSSNQSIIELGIQQTKNEWDFNLKPIENNYLDNQNWYRLEDINQNLVLTEKGDEVVQPSQEGEEIIETIIRSPRFSNVSDFLQNIPRDKITAEYNIDLKRNFILPGYQKSEQGLIINSTLRGRHDFYTYIKDEPLNFKVDFQDLNRRIGPDRFHINIYRGDSELVYTQSAQDDGNEAADGVGSVRQTLEINLPDLAEGLYRIEFDVNDDLVIRELETNQHLLVAQGGIFTIDNEDYQSNLLDLQLKGTTVYTRSRTVNLITHHYTGVQTVSLADQKVEITQPNDRKSFTFLDMTILSNQLDKIEMPKSDVVLTGNGYFSFTPESYFDPASYLIPLRHNTSLDDIDYVVAKDYSSPIEDDYWKSASQIFDLHQSYITEDRELKFIISAPGLKDRNGFIKIRSIKVELEREPLSFTNIFPSIKKFFTNN